MADSIFVRVGDSHGLFSEAAYFAWYARMRRTPQKIAGVDIYRVSEEEASLLRTVFGNRDVVGNFPQGLDPDFGQVCCSGCGCGFDEGDALGSMCITCRAESN